MVSRRGWPRVTPLLVGAILAPGPRTVAAAWRVLAWQDDRPLGNDHRVLTRARGSSRALSPIPRGLLARAFVVAGAPVIVGRDATIERRRGAQIAAKGIYRDPVRSRKGHFVKASGRRWVALQMGVARGCSNCGAGCQIGPWWRWPTVRTPRGICWPPARARAAALYWGDTGTPPAGTGGDRCGLG